MPVEAQRFTRLELVRARLPLRLTFRHAGAARAVTEALLLVLHDDRGVRGYGELIPRPYLTGETIDSCVRDLRAEHWPRLKALALGPDTAPSERLAELWAAADASGRTAAYGGLDLAVHDAWGRRFGVPGRRLLGAPAAAGPARPLTATIGLGMPPRLAATLARAAGFRDFKVKVGAADLGADAAHVAAVRRAVGAAASLRADANGAWTPAAAAAGLARLAPYRLACIEQPLARGSAEALGALAGASATAVMADESLCTTADAAALLAAAPQVLWNLRLAKVGGFTGLLRLARLAQAGGVRCQLGALVGETSLLTAAARACVGVADFAWVESAFPRLLLRYDPFRGGPPALAPTAAPLGERPGLGVEPAPAAWRAVAGETLVLS